MAAVAPRLHSRVIRKSWQRRKLLRNEGLRQIRATADGGRGEGGSESVERIRYSFFNSSVAEYDTRTSTDTISRKTKYEECPLDILLMWIFARHMASVSSNPLPSLTSTNYTTFVNAANNISLVSKDPKVQKEAVLSLLMSLVPKGVSKVFRSLSPRSKWSCELNAQIAAGPAFGWLVGPTTVEEVDVGGGEKWKSKVVIKKCRYLEASGCNANCVNLCKAPTQAFFAEAFGLPLTMNPDFDTGSCDMIFGVDPPQISSDVASCRPCSSDCEAVSGDSRLPCHKMPKVSQEFFCKYLEDTAAEKEKL